MFSFKPCSIALAMKPEITCFDVLFLGSFNKIILFFWIKRLIFTFCKNLRIPAQIKISILRKSIGKKNLKFSTRKKFQASKLLKVIYLKMLQ